MRSPKVTIKRRLDKRVFLSIPGIRSFRINVSSVLVSESVRRSDLFYNNKGVEKKMKRFIAFAALATFLFLVSSVQARDWYGPQGPEVRGHHNYHHTWHHKPVKWKHHKYHHKWKRPKHHHAWKPKPAPWRHPKYHYSWQDRPVRWGYNDFYDAWNY